MAKGLSSVARILCALPQNSMGCGEVEKMRAGNRSREIVGSDRAHR
jgi:hypothetical protein